MVRKTGGSRSYVINSRNIKRLNSFGDPNRHQNHHHHDAIRFSVVRPKSFAVREKLKPERGLRQSH